jgi:hypothetical protein
LDEDVDASTYMHTITKLIRKNNKCYIPYDPTKNC